MPATRRKKAPVPADALPKCGTCKGSGEVSVAVRVGRKRRVVGKQTGMCLTCLGSGHATD